MPPASKARRRLRIGEGAAYLVFDGIEVRNAENNVVHIDGNAHHITLLQVELRRFQREGKDADEVRRKLAHLHTLHMQVLAVQERLRKALKDVRGS